MDAKVNELHAKTKLFADQNIAAIIRIKSNMGTQSDKLRTDVTNWSSDYAKKIEAMVQSGNFSYEGTKGVTSNTAGQIDKKEVSVWKVSDNVSKPDFRHWLDSVDLQLEAIHGFVCPDLVLDKVKRLPTEVTAQAPENIIVDSNAEHKKKISSDAPPGIDAAPPRADTLGSLDWGAGPAQELYLSIRASGTLPKSPGGFIPT